MTNSINKKKATFELKEDIHKKLKIQAAIENRNMVMIVEEALTDYFQKKNSSSFSLNTELDIKK